MRAQTWLSMVVVASLMALLSSTAWSCPPSERPPSPSHHDARAATGGDLVHHLSHWRGPHGESWMVASDARNCGELDLDELAAIGRVDAVDCRPIEIERLTLVLPAEMIDDERIASPALDPLERVLERLDVPVDVVGYDARTEALGWFARDVAATDALSVAAHTWRMSTRADLGFPRRSTESEIAWLARSVIALDDVQPGQAVVLFASLPEGPPGVAQVQHALGLMPNAQYLVVDRDTAHTVKRFTHRTSRYRQPPRHHTNALRIGVHTPQLDGISDTGYATGMPDAATLERLLFGRYQLQARTRPHASPAPALVVDVDAPTDARATRRCGARDRHHAPAAWFLVVLTLWYVIGLKVAMFLMLHRRSPSR